MALLRLQKSKAIAPADQAGAFRDWLADNFVIPSGISRGRPFEIHDFQLDFLRGFLARDDLGWLYRTSALSVPRKLGKSTFLGAILCGLGEKNSPIYLPDLQGAIASVSAHHSQMLADSVVTLMEAAGRGDRAKIMSRPVPGALFVGDATFSLTSGSAKQGHGRDLDLALIDECGLLGGRQQELVGAYFDALSARDGRLLLTGTRGFSPDYNRLLDEPDERTFVYCRSASRDDDPSNPDTWDKANPDSGRIKPRTFLRDAFLRAKASGNLTEFCAWQLNQRFTPTRELLFELETLKRAYRDDPQPIEGEPCWIGLDLGGSASMTAAVIAYESGLLKVLGAFPAEPMSLLERGQRDGVGDLYERAHAAGDLILTEGQVSDLGTFLAELVKRIGNHPVVSVSCDRYRQAEQCTARGRSGLGWKPIFRGTGPKDGDQDVRATRRLFMAGAVHLKESVLLTGAIAEADIRVSATGACQVDKSHRLARVDPVSALTLACSTLLSARDTIPTTYEIEVL
jgi:phage terminase large subunit-like protein